MATLAIVVCSVVGDVSNILFPLFISITVCIGALIWNFRIKLNPYVSVIMIHDLGSFFVELTSDTLPEQTARTDFKASSNILYVKPQLNS